MWLGIAGATLMWLATSAAAFAQGQGGASPAPASSTSRDANRAQPDQAAASAKVSRRSETGGEHSSSVKKLNEVVVTGSPTYFGVKKLDASFSITTATRQQIKEAQPLSSADLLKIVPGLWAESSGGQTGANIELAGFPGGGDAPYITYEINGSPVFPVPTLSFMENSSLFRIDDTIQRVEVLQGGPSVVLSNGQIGATANFLLREGTPRPSGESGLTIGSDGLYRFDGFYGDKLASGWYGSVGGFYRTADGIRSPQFPSDEGGQITATLSHDFKRGHLMFYVRSLSDNNLFITDVPLAVSPDGMNVSNFPGFDALTGTFASNALRMANIEVTPGSPPGTINADLAKGRGAHIRLFGSNLDMQLGSGWLLSDAFNYTSGRMPTNALFNNFPPERLGQFINDTINSANADPAVVKAAGGPASSGSATYVQGGGSVSPNTPVASVGFWVVDKNIRSFSNEARVTKNLFKGNSLTLGTYVASYSAADTWYLGNNILVTAHNNAQPINVTLDNGVQVTRNGFLSGPFYALNASYSGRNLAASLFDQQHLGPWLLDAALRVENQKINGSVSNDSTVDLDNNAKTLYNNSTAVANGSFTPVHSDQTRVSWTVGANYEITANMSAYLRVNEGWHFPAFDDLRNGTPQTQKIKNLEVGYKVQMHRWFGALTVFRRLFDGVPFQAFLANGSNFVATYGAETTGLDLTTSWEPIDRLNLTLSGDYQNGKYGHFASPNGAFDFNGSVLQRQPRLQFRITPSYMIPTYFGRVQMFATYTHVGLRYSNPGNQQVLPSYYTLDAGVIGYVGRHLELRVQGTNLTNQIGLTEGNARLLNTGIVGGLEMARPIFGREVQGQVVYRF